MDRRPSDQPSEPVYYGGQRFVEEPETYDEPSTVVVQPVKKKSRWKKIFSRKKGKKDKASTTVKERPLPATPSSESPFAEPGILIPPRRDTVPASDISTSRRYELSDPGVVPRRMDVTESRDESLRARSAVGSGSVFGPGQARTTVVPPNEAGLFRPAPGVASRQDSTFGPTPVRQRFEGRPYTETSSILDEGPTPMLVDRQSGNRVPRDVSYASTGSHPATDPAKKKRSFGGTLKRMFRRKKKPLQPITVDQPPRHSIEVEQYDHYPEDEYPRDQDVYQPPLPPVAESAPVVESGPVVVQVPASRSAHTRSTRSSTSAAPLVIPPPATVVVPASAKTHSSRSSAPPVVSPRSSRSRRSAPSDRSDVVVPITPRTSIPHRTGTGGSSTVYRPRFGTNPPERHPTGATYESRRRGTPVPVVRHESSDSPSPSARSVEGTDRNWAEVHVPPEPIPVTSRSGGVGLGTRPITTPRSYVPRPSRTRVRYPAAPAPRTPYVHVPRPIPPPPVYPSRPTIPRTTGAGLEAQVQLIVTALRDLAAEDRHRTAVAQQRLDEERAWNDAERARDEELRYLVRQLAARGGGQGGHRTTRRVETTTRVGATTPGSGGAESVRTTSDLGATAAHGPGFGATVMPETTGMGEFGVREQVGITARGLGVGGSDVERLILIMRQGHEVTMQTFRDLIDTWRKDIDIKHEEFLAEQRARADARDRKREKPIRWQPGVNIWNPT